MGKGRFMPLLALLWLTAGCCSHPGLFNQVEHSLKTVQDYYGPLLEAEGWDRQEKLRQAVVAADTTLLLAAELQRQWCPDPLKAQQLELQAGQAAKLAQEAGVVEAGRLEVITPGKSGE